MAVLLFLIEARPSASLAELVPAVPLCATTAGALTSPAPGLCHRLHFPVLLVVSDNLNHSQQGTRVGPKSPEGAKSEPQSASFP